MTEQADRLAAMLASRPRVREFEPMTLLGIEDRLSDHALMHMIDKGHLLGPYRPTRPLVVDALHRIRWALVHLCGFNRRSPL